MHTHFSSCWLVSFSSSQRLVSCELADWSAATSTWCRIAAYVIASPLSFCNRWSQRDTSTFFNTYGLRRSTSCCRANILQYPSSHMSPYSGIFVSVALSQTGLDTVGPRIRSWCMRGVSIVKLLAKVIRIDKARLSVAPIFPNWLR